jgi:hypothetical protein
MRGRVAGWSGVLGVAGVWLAVSGCGRQAVVAPVADLVADRNPDAPGPRPKDEEPAGGFAFPRDAGGALLARLLPPADRTVGPGDRTTQPVPRPAPSNKTTFDPLPPARAQNVAPPLPAKAKAAPLLPRMVSEETLDAPRERVALPAELSLPATERVRIPSPNINEPVALPVLAQPVPDRASLEDPTGDASTAAALAATLPQRVIPAPFLRLALPEPFEFRRPLTLATPAETADPRTCTPQTPKP